MKLSFPRYPADIILCVLLSFLLIPLSFIDVGELLHVILGLPFVIFIPGYVLVFALFPTRKSEKGIDTVERIALSIGLSLVIVALIGVGLNYTPFDIQQSSSGFCLFFFIISVGAVAIYRWIKAASDERFFLSIHLSLTTPKHNVDKVLLIMLVIVIALTIVTFAYVAITPKSAETYTEFYLLGSDGTLSDYPQNLYAGENATVTVGITNHEHRPVDYTIEIWILNQTISYEGLKNTTIYHNAWFLRKINITLPYESKDTEMPWTPQWLYNYTFNITKKGEFKVLFLLFTAPTQMYVRYEDYTSIIEQNINNAYEELHLNVGIL